MTESLIFMKIKKLSIGILLLLIIIVGLVTNDEFKSYLVENIENIKALYINKPLMFTDLFYRNLHNYDNIIITCSFANGSYCR